MITSITPKGFRAVSYLETAKIMEGRDCIEFSTDKPNVIVGPNGSGKSALLNTLSMLTLTYYMDVSTFDQHYINMSDSDLFWLPPIVADTDRWRWRDDRLPYLHGLQYEGQLVPTLYYRPNRLPGNEHDVAHAMCMGYSEPARAMGALIRNKSSGQKSQAIQQRLLDVLSGAERLKFETYRFGDPNKLEKIDRQFYSGDIPFKTNTFKQYYLSRVEDGRQLVIMDEPEQSLDLEAEIKLWHAIHNKADHVQVICATHSLYPILNPQHFNIIETVAGYTDRVRALFMV